MSGGDELGVEDGQSALCGAGGRVWVIYPEHPLIEPFVREYNFGYSDADAEHWMIFDTVRRCAFVALARETLQFLQSQWPKSEPKQLTPEELQALVESLEVE